MEAGNLSRAGNKFLGGGGGSALGRGLRLALAGSGNSRRGGRPGAFAVAHRRGSFANCRTEADTCRGGPDRSKSGRDHLARAGEVRPLRFAEERGRPVRTAPRGARLSPLPDIR